VITQLAEWQGRKSRIPFDMLSLERSAEEARRHDKLRHIYHRGQDLAWDGRAVLKELLARHGGVQVAPALVPHLSKVFEMILWGELAAWKISAELADQLVPVEAKLAATSQAHDEARHFYVMNDYLRELGYVPARIDPFSQRVLDLILGARTLTHKLLAMQLMLETIALTIFAEVRESRVEPVLADLLHYYEKDEARHVGLGTQYLPSLLKVQTRLESAETILFQVRLAFWTTASLKAMEKDLHAIGIPAPRLIERGVAIQTKAFQEMWGQMGGAPASHAAFDRVMRGIDAALFPGVGTPVELRGAVTRFAAEYRRAQSEQAA
jgi:hypothetical protein